MSKFFRGSVVAALLMAGTAVAEPLDFSLPDADGKRHSLAEYRGKWVVLNYWATWCPPCIEEIPDLVAFHERHKNSDAVVIGLNYEDIPAAQLKAFIDEYFISYPVLVNGDMQPAHERLAVGGLPTTYIVSPDGELVARQVGGITGAAIEAFIERRERSQDGADEDVEAEEVQP